MTDSKRDPSSSGFSPLGEPVALDLEAIRARLTALDRAFDSHCGDDPPYAEIEATLEDTRALMVEVALLQAALDALYGAKFSDRVYYALKSRAETAEAEVIRLRSAVPAKEAVDAEHPAYAFNRWFPTSMAGDPPFPGDYSSEQLRGVMYLAFEEGHRLARSAVPSEPPPHWQPIEMAPLVEFGAVPVDVMVFGPSLGVREGRACRMPDGYVFADVPHINGNLAWDGYVTMWQFKPAPPSLAPSDPPAPPQRTEENTHHGHDRNDVSAEDVSHVRNDRGIRDLDAGRGDDLPEVQGRREAGALSDQLATFGSGGPEAAPALLKQPNYDQIDPGIRATVKLLRAEGFETTDSGDGVSKPRAWYASGEAMSCPNVAMHVTLTSIVPEAHRLLKLLGPDWQVQAMYSPNDGIATLLATRGDPERQYENQRATASICESCAKMREDSDREFIEQKWRAGAHAAEYAPSDDCPYHRHSLAGTWWWRGYESMRAILKQTTPPSPSGAAPPAQVFGNSAPASVAKVSPAVGMAAWEASESNVEAGATPPPHSDETDR